MDNVYVSLKDFLNLHSSIAGVFKEMPFDMLDRCSVERFDKGEIIIRKDEEIDEIHLLCSGRVKLINEFENGVVYAFGELTSINFIGDIEVMAGVETAAATIKAVEGCTTVCIDRDDFQQWLSLDRTLPIMLAKKYAKRMWNQSRKKGEHIVLSGINRVIMAITTGYKKDVDEDIPIKIDKKRQELADEVGMSLKTVNRSINRLKEENLISINKGKIYISGNQYNELVEKLQQKI